MTAWTIAVLCGCGMATSLLSALFGVGGSILLVPVLHLLFPQCAVQVLAATSLTVVMLSALINVFAFWRQGIRLNTRLLMLWSLGMAMGMQVGMYASFWLSDKVLLGLFALVLVGLALRCGYSHQTTEENVQPDNRTRSIGMLLCTAGGAVAGLTGLGGGSVLAPLMSQLSGLPSQHVSVYCNWMMLFGSAGTVVSYLYHTMPDTGALPLSMQFGYVNMAIVTVIFLCTLVFQPVSMRLRTLLPECWLQRVFSGVLLMIAMLILVTL
ncbi:TPA: sulfite exporter TauE/SafE family protein [Escherichia coli]|nr:sulfite exporter TauE/SafE family protein [Escherichia coli]HEL8044480.1 sulfite exporter TauE/SafE family protein [Escherichia coli]HEL8049279.1 sulfite exporter TauE/SafE family protein [Escherichia coli]HEL8054028.1 sulfite exporter TauE/SafE family protein [Escherichia coli]HEL8058919.1 sulfite exporter TauE/SafE family protein [Escherichia coli]